MSKPDTFDLARRLLNAARGEIRELEKESGTLTLDDEHVEMAAVGAAITALHAAARGPAGTVALMRGFCSILAIRAIAGALCTVGSIRNVDCDVLLKDFIDAYYDMSGVIDQAAWKMKLRGRA